MGEVLRFTWYDIRRLLTSPRLYVSLFIVYACFRICFGDVHLYVEESGEPLQALELFIFASCNRLPQWIIAFGMLLLLGDAPFFREGMSVHLVRSTRFRWLMGQILFCLVTVVFYLLAVEVMLLSLSGSGVSFLNDWSDSIWLASRITNGGDLLHITLIFDFPASIVSGGTPLAMFALTMLYDTLLLTMFSLLCLACNARWRTGVGCFGVVALLVLRFLIDDRMVLTVLWPVSPCNLAAVSARAISLESTGYVTAYFLCVCGLLGIWGYRTIRSADLQKAGGT